MRKTGSQTRGGVQRGDGLLRLIPYLVLPAIAVCPTQASVILSLSNPTCNISTAASAAPNPTCTAGADAVAVADNGLSGETLYLTNPGNSVTASLAPVSSTIVTALTLSTSGVAGGSGSVANGTTIPFNYSFLASLTGPNITLSSYIMEFNITTTPGINGSGSVFGGPVISPMITLNGQTTANPAGSLSSILSTPISAGTTYYETANLLLFMNATASGGQSLILSVDPSNAFKINDVDPEPATLALSASAFAGLLLWARRRKKSA